MMNGMVSVVGIAPGEYTLDEIAAGTSRVVRSQRVDVSTSSVTLPLGAAESAVTVKVAIQARPGMKLPDNLQLGFRDEKARRISPNQPAINGGTEFTNVRAGDYSVVAFSNGQALTVGSVNVDGHLAHGAHLHITAAADVSVVATLGGASVKVEGTVRHGGKPAAGSMVVLVPAESGAGSELFRRDETNLDGSFSLENVVPGRYILVAIDDGWTLRWNDPAALMPYLLHGIPLEVSTGGSGDVRLKAAVVAQSR